MTTTSGGTPLPLTDCTSSCGSYVVSMKELNTAAPIITRNRVPESSIVSMAAARKTPPLSVPRQKAMPSGPYAPRG